MASSSKLTYLERKSSQVSFQEIKNLTANSKVVEERLRDATLGVLKLDVERHLLKQIGRAGMRQLNEETIEELVLSYIGYGLKDESNKIVVSTCPGHCTFDSNDQLLRVNEVKLRNGQHRLEALKRFWNLYPESKNEWKTWTCVIYDGRL